jgi:proline dehydrogenase
MLISAYRQTLLTVAEQPAIKAFAHKQGWKLGVGRFVAGETLEQALPALERLTAQGLKTNLDLLGEFIESASGAQQMTETIIATLEQLAHSQADRYMSIKPTQLGLGLDVDLAYANARRILEQAKALSAHICFDMENTPYLEPTLALFERLYGEGFTGLSTVLQSYLKRTPEDLARLASLTPKPFVRLVKGAYKEPPELAYQDKATVDRQLLELIYSGLEQGLNVGIATHDERIIQETQAYLRGAGVEASRYEYQLLYGVKLGLQRQLAARHPVRIYVPYGQDWYGYFSRRLAERPANLLFVLRGLFG